MDYSYSKDFYVCIENMDNDEFITSRLNDSQLTGKARSAYERILKFIYKIEYNGKTNRATNRKYSNLLTEAEKTVLFRLETRCSGSERYQYGPKSVIAIRRARYKCEVCGERDIRCLEIDHKYGRKEPEAGTKWVQYEIDDFQCLCANHHRIKTVIYAQQKLIGIL